jgi:hypothetical protein
LIWPLVAIIVLFLIVRQAISTVPTLPPSATARNAGPALISAAVSQVCIASTGRRRYAEQWLARRRKELALLASETEHE